MEIYLQFVPTELNVIPDLLSRWGKGSEVQKKLECMRQPDWQQYEVLPQDFQLHDQW